MKVQGATARPPIERMAISHFKATCLAVLERVRRTGQPLLVTKRGKPVAQIGPPPPLTAAAESRFGCMRGKIEFLGDIVEPLPEEEWEALR
jgi:prevent-host-death family protein